VPGSGAGVLSGNALSRPKCNEARQTVNTKFHHTGQIVIAFNSFIEHSRYWTSLFWRDRYEQRIMRLELLRRLPRRTVIEGPSKIHRKHASMGFSRPIEAPSRILLDGDSCPADDGWGWMGQSAGHDDGLSATAPAAGRRPRRRAPPPPPSSTPGAACHVRHRPLRPPSSATSTAGYLAHGRLPPALHHPRSLAPLPLSCTTPSSVWFPLPGGTPSAGCRLRGRAPLLPPCATPAVVSHPRRHARPLPPCATFAADT